MSVGLGEFFLNKKVPLQERSTLSGLSGVMITSIKLKGWHCCFFCVCMCICVNFYQKMMWSRRHIYIALPFGEFFSGFIEGITPLWIMNEPLAAIEAFKEEVSGLRTIH